jgi:hypothetical protein
LFVLTRDKTPESSVRGDFKGGATITVALKTRHVGKSLMGASPGRLVLSFSQINPPAPFDTPG